MNILILITYIHILFFKKNSSPLDEYSNTKHLILGKPQIIDEIINNYDHMIVYFHKPSCIHCTEFEKVIYKITNYFYKTHSLLPFIEVDCSIFKKYCRETMKIHQFPTIRFYYNKSNKHINYRFERKFELFKTWITERINNHVIKITKKNSHYIKHLITEGDSIVIFNGNESSKNFDFYSETSKTYDLVYFFYTEDSDIIKEYDLKTENSIIFLKLEKKIRYLEVYSGPLIEASLVSFIEHHDINTIFNYDNYLIQENNKKKKPFVILFSDETDIDIITDFEFVAKLYKDKFYFILVNLNTSKDSMVDKLIYDLGITSKDMPCMRIINYYNYYNFDKYLLRKDKYLNMFSMKNFVIDYKKYGTYSKVEELGDNPNEEIKSINSKTYIEKVKKNYDDNYIIFVYSIHDSCKICNDVLDILIKIKDNFVDKEIIFYRINLHFNEIDDKYFTKYPRLLYVDKGDYTRDNIKQMDLLNASEMGIINFINKAYDESQSENDIGEL